MAKIFNIAQEYNRILGGRWIRLGEFSGEDFYNRVLEPNFKEACQNNTTFTVELDGTTGYPSSFLDQSFGELARRYGKDLVKNTVILKANIFAWIVEYINTEIWDKTEK
jgi:hypothetical protein